MSRSLVRLDAVGLRGSAARSASGADRVAALSAWAHRRGFRRARDLLLTRTAVVDLCRAMAAELRSGRASAEAFAAAVQAGPTRLSAALQSAVAVGRRGDNGDLADAVARVAESPGCEGLRAIVACWRVAAASGAALAPAIDRVADALQDEIDLGREVSSIMAGPRATVHVLAALPVIGLLLGTAIGARPIGFLFGSVPGVGCLVGAVVLDALGIAWSRRIARRAARLG
ncbi:MAG TPA: type II secretion system F family protein [Acidothermaceae bacterium]|jgi:tight adherence protein B